MRRTAARTAALLLTAGLVTLGATACGPTDSSVSTTAKTTAAAPAKGSSAPAKAGGSASAAKLGDTIALKGTDASNTADVTVVKLADNAEGADEFTKPADGKRFVSVQFRIKATGAKGYNDAPQNSAKLIDAQGQSYGSTVSETKAGPAFQVPAAIAAGESALGFITFEVPADAKLAKVQFALDSGFAQQSGQWNLV